MKTSKTKELLINTARELFAENGVGNTTMNDIADRAKKGRRTLYLYFKSKEDIYISVIEQELDILKKRLEVVMKKDVNPKRKLVEYVMVRLDTINEIIERNGSLKSDFFNNISEVKKARVKIDVLELQFISRILQEGNDKGVFVVDNVSIAALMILYSMQGIEAPYAKMKFRNKIRQSKDNIIRFLLKGLKA